MPNEIILPDDFFAELDKIKDRIRRLEISRPDAEGPVGSGSGPIIADESADLPTEPRLTFQGTGVNASDDATNNRTIVSIPGAEVTQAELDAVQAELDADEAALASHNASTTGIHGIPTLATGQGLLWVAGSWVATDITTQAELDAHKTSSDHDGRYYTETEMDTFLGLRVAKTGDVMTGVLTTTGVTIPPTVGTAKGRFATLPGIANWFGMFMNATFNGSAWVLDDTTVPGWFFKLDSRAGGLASFAVYLIPAGANPHSDEYPVLSIDPAGLVTFRNRLTGVADGINPSDVATLGQVQGLIGGLRKTSARAATTANITLSGTQTVDGVALVAGDRVLVKNQTAPAQNGPYVVAAGAWSRVSDMDTAAEVDGSFVIVEDGGQAGTLWVTTSEVTTLGTDPIVWTQFNSAADIIAGNGLTKTGNTLDANVDGVSLEIIADALRIKAGGHTHDAGDVNSGTFLPALIPSATAIARGGIVLGYSFGNGDLGGTSTAPLVPDMLRKSLLDVKGDIIAATAADTPARVPAAASDGMYLRSDAAMPTGLRWDVPSASIVIDGSPVGAVISWTSNTIPDDYLLANGQTVTEANYPQLVAFAAKEVAAGNTLWGITGTAPNRTATLPNLSNRFLYGKAASGTGATLGATGGAETHSLTGAESGMPSHAHSASTQTPSSSIGESAGMYHRTNAGDLARGDNTGNNGNSGAVVVTVAGAGPINASSAHNNMPPYCVLAFVVKAKSIAVSAASLVSFENWHSVGGGGTEPAFQGNWINYDTAVYDGLIFRKTPDGRLQIRGMVKPSSGTSGANSTVFFLPTGYIPTKTQILRGQMSSSGAADVRIDPDGKVYVATSGLSWVSFDVDIPLAAISYPAGAAVDPNKQIAKVTNATAYTFTGLDLPNENEYRITIRGNLALAGADRKITARLGGQTGGFRGITHRFYKDVNSENTVHDFVEEQRDGTAPIIARSDYGLGGDLIAHGILAHPGTSGANAIYTGDATYRPYGGTFGVGVLGYHFTCYHAVSGLPTTLEINFGGGTFTGDIILEKVSKTSTTLGVPVAEAWRELGVGTNPSLAGTWSFYGSGYSTPAFYLDTQGRVLLKGLVKRTGTDTIIFTLPVGYRPKSERILTVSSNDAYAEVRIRTNGDVAWSSGGNPNSWVSLDELSFRAEQ